MAQIYEPGQKIVDVTENVGPDHRLVRSGCPFQFLLDFSLMTAAFADMEFPPRATYTWLNDEGVRVQARVITIGSPAERWSVGVMSHTRQLLATAHPKGKEELSERLFLTPDPLPYSGSPEPGATPQEIFERELRERFAAGEVVLQVRSRADLESPCPTIAEAAYVVTDPGEFALAALAVQASFGQETLGLAAFSPGIGEGTFNAYICPPRGNILDTETDQSIGQPIPRAMSLDVDLGGYGKAILEMTHPSLPRRFFQVRMPLIIEPSVVLRRFANASDRPPIISCRFPPLPSP
jgi:hypothetical protein